MKKTITIIAIIGIFSAFSAAKAQPLQYFMQRSSGNATSMSEVQNLQVLLTGAHNFLGFEGAPKNILLDVATPISKKQRAIYNPYGEIEVRNFIGGTLSNETFGVHANLQATLSYAYRFRTGKSTNITLGLSSGINQISSDFGKTGDEFASLYSQKETKFAWQFGTRIETDRLNILAFGNDKTLSAEIVFGRLWDYVQALQNNNYDYDDDELKAWNGQLSAMFCYSGETQKSLLRFSANAVYKGGLGIGMSYQTDKNLSANISLKLTKSLRIGYAYQLLQLNRVAARHEVAIQYRLIQLTEE